ncbi:MAG: hypothetical protein JKY52_13580 [Flavobacteriales bacterium]|nr:hypothetical protein [Flavobacteriales bacterium]
MPDKILNNDPANEKSYTAMRSVKWWEKKRLAFNIVLLLFTTLFIWLKQEVPNARLNSEWVIRTVIWIVGANMFFCGSWGGELLWTYYLNRTPFWVDFRLLLFILGTLFSIIWTWLVLIPGI